MAILDAFCKNSFLRSIYRYLFRCYFSLVCICKIAYFYHTRPATFTGNANSNIVVSLTSFPPRIDLVWITIESLFRQNHRPWKIILVLSDDEFPERNLPEKLVSQTERGLEILWTTGNTRGYKKLLPVRQTHPESTIVTVDDDVIYEPWRLRKLIEASSRFPACVIGHRGRLISTTEGGLKPYSEWPLAPKTGPSQNILLTGIGGILYPPSLLKESLLQDIGLATRLCPTADDIWFWAVTIESGVPIVCLGSRNQYEFRSGEVDEALSELNRKLGHNDSQMASVLDYFQIHIEEQKP